MDRRNFILTLGAAGSTCLAPTSQASSLVDEENVYGVLIDTTQCIGCRKCEWACDNFHELSDTPLEEFEDQSVFEEERRPDDDQYTVVNQYENTENPIWVKFQCMHCNQPACRSACLVTAFDKNEDGSVTYNAWKCMGCRYCLVACPFQIPAYEYENPLTPEVRKCTFCHERLEEGQAPACVTICPPQCLTFGKREDLIQLAHNKIEEHPDRYIDHVYGEHEVGGTSWMYVSGKPFEQLGLPNLPEESPPQTTEDIQHGIFKYFIPQVALFAVLGMIAKLTGSSNSNEGESKPKTIQHHEKPTPANARFFTPTAFVLLFLALIGFTAAMVRFVVGLGPVTNLDNQYPWGIWIAIDVATGVALAAGGFTMGALVYLFHRERYHPLMRPALLTALLGYTFVVLGLLVDLGRYYNVWHPILPNMWSGHSVLFEVGMCVMFYLTVLYLEFLPIVVERFKGKVNLPGSLARFNSSVESLLSLLDRGLSKVMLALIIAGILLSCLHQSSLGALMLIAPNKMHPLWYTPVLPLFFLISAICVGYPMVIFESMLASKMVNRKPEMHILKPLSKIVPVLLVIYLACKLSDIAIREVEAYLVDGSIQSYLFHAELILGVVVPIIMFLSDRIRSSLTGLFAASAFVVFGVALNRINVFLTAYTPVYKVQTYLPSFSEVAVTIGLISALVLAYRIIVIYFPVLPQPEEEQSHS